MGKETENNELSLSKQRKIARMKEIEKMKNRAILIKVCLVLAAFLIVGLSTWAIVSAQIKKAKQVTASTDFSEGLEENGMIKGIKASDYITMPDYNNITASLSEIEYSDEDVESDIEDILEKHKVLSTSGEAVAAEGDTVNIDYVGTIDGVEFDGGTASGSEIKLGSGSLIDDFEKQIEGHKIGDKFDVNVTFPEDYREGSELNGKDAVFAVTLNGIYVNPEFTDDFVKEYLSENASTAEEYRKYLKDTNYKENLTDFVKKYVEENTTVNKTPSTYLKQLKSNYKANEQYSYEYMSSMYSQYYGTSPYKSFEDYLSQTYSMTEEEYDESLDEKVNSNLKYTLFCQGYAEAEGITATLDEAREYYIAEGGTEDNFNSQIESYGKGYMVQMYLCDKVIKSVSERVKVQ